LPDTPATPAPEFVSSDFHSITLTWPAVPGATGYEVVTSPNPNLSSPQILTSTATPSVTVDQLLANTAYYSQVRAIRGGVSSPFSAIVSAHTWFSVTLNQQLSPTIIRVAWEVVEGAAFYKVVLSNLDPTKPSVTIQITSNDIVIKELGVSNSYAMSINAYRPNFEPFATAQPQTVRTLSGPPSNVTATVLTSTSVKFGWLAGEGAVEYALLVSPHADFSDPAFVLFTSDLFGTITGLSADTHYFARVFSFNESHFSTTGVPSEVIEFTLPAAASNLFISGFGEEEPGLLYPNPAKDRLTVQLPTEGKSSIAIKDLSGRPILQNTYQQSSVNINLAGIQPGFYVVEIVQGIMRKTMHLQIEQ